MSDIHHDLVVGLSCHHFSVVWEYYNYGDIAPLKEIMAMKEKYCFRMILDETHSIGVLGKTGRGLCEHVGVKQRDIEILLGSLSYAFGSAGGFCCGDRHVVYHQRLNGSGYCFSASMPPYLASVGHSAIDILDRDHAKILPKLQKNTTTMQNSFKGISGVTVDCVNLSPVIHVRLANSTGSRDGDEEILENIVDFAMKNYNVFLTRAKYIDDEKFPPPPSIRVCANASMDQKEVETVCMALRESVEAVLKK